MVTFTPAPTLPSLSSPSTFNARAIALFDWLTGTYIPEQEAITAQDFADYSEILGFRNKIINGEGLINQRSASTISDDEYGHDRHYALTQSNDIAVSTVTNAETGVRSLMRLTQSNASPQRMGYAQIIESTEAYALRGKTITIGGKLEYSNAAAVRYAVLEWTGTADSVTSDVVNDWTDGTYAAGNFFNATTLNVLAVGSTTPSAGALTDWNLTATVGSSANNLIVFMWTEGTSAQNSTLDLRWYLVEGDATNEDDPGSWRDQTTERLLCERYYRYMTSPLRSVGIYAATGNGVSLPIPFRVRMRAAPTLAIEVAGPFNNGSGGSVGIAGVDGFRAAWTVTSTGISQWVSQEISADAEL